MNKIKGIYAAGMSVFNSDLSLNISREMLQQDRQLKKIAKAVENKIKSELEKMQKNDRDLYNDFYQTYGVNLKYGIYEGYGVNKELLQDLVMFKTINSDAFKTLKEYNINIITKTIFSHIYAGFSLISKPTEYFRQPTDFNGIKRGF